jgi:hypothetical protein
MTIRSLTTILLCVLALALGVPATSFAAAPNYKITQHIKLPDGGFDYITFDPVTSRVYIARTDFTNFIDTKTGQLGELHSAQHGHMVVPVAGTTLGVLPVGAGKVLIVDTAKDAAVATLPGGKGPDGAAYDPFSKSVFVMNKRGGDASMVDPVAGKITATIPIGGSLEFPASDGAGKVFVNVEDKGEIAVIDVKEQKVINRYKLNDCDGPTGLAYIADLKALVSSCDGATKVIRAADGKELASLKTGGGPDAVIYDPVRKLAFIPCSDEGVLDVISLANPAHIAIVQQIATSKGTRTGAVDPKDGKIYLVAAQVKPKSGDEEHAGRIPGTYEVLVLNP